MRSHGKPIVSLNPTIATMWKYNFPLQCTNYLFSGRIYSIDIINLIAYISSFRASSLFQPFTTCSYYFYSSYSLQPFLLLFVPVLHYLLIFISVSAPPAPAIHPAQAPAPASSPAPWHSWPPGLLTRSPPQPPVPRSRTLHPRFDTLTTSHVFA